MYSVSYSCEGKLAIWNDSVKYRYMHIEIYLERERESKCI